MIIPVYTMKIYGLHENFMGTIGLNYSLLVDDSVQAFSINFCLQLQQGTNKLTLFNAVMALVAVECLWCSILSWRDSKLSIQWTCFRALNLLVPSAWELCTTWYGVILSVLLLILLQLLVQSWNLLPYTGVLQAYPRAID